MMVPRMQLQPKAWSFRNDTRLSEGSVNRPHNRVLSTEDLYQVSYHHNPQARSY